ncbi:MAG: SusC/RagA family TonB-linked outer membrane protein [Odoribacter splanchnicus]
MKLLFLLVVLFGSNLSARVLSQERITIQLGKTTISRVFDEIRKQTERIVVYNDNKLMQHQQVIADFNNVPLETVLKNLLEGSGVTYEFVDEYIVIVPSKTSDFNQQNQQKRTIRGIVKNASESLPGVSVVVKGTTVGVVTDLNGKFELMIDDDPATVLVFSFVGMITQEVKVGEKSVLEVYMQENISQLGEVVCTGYQTLSRERSTGAFGSLSAKNLNNRVTPDFISRIEGKIAGLQIDRDNKITIRGRGSIYSNTEPLIVVDGFPIEGGINTINPDDIENLTVLKDAAAASIWGVRAANGVIVITTKQGKQNRKTDFDFSYYCSIHQKPDFSDLRMLSPKESVDFELERIQKGWWTPNDVVYYNNPVNKVQEIYYNTLQRLGNNVSYEDITADTEFQEQINLLQKADLYKQYKKYLLRNAIDHRLNASLSGGSKKIRYYSSLVYNNNKLSEIGNDNQNVNINLKSDYDLNRHLKLYTGVNVLYSRNKENGISVLDTYDRQPYEDIVDEKGQRIPYYIIDPWEGKKREEMGYLPYTTNLLDRQENNDITSSSFAARLQAGLKLDILPGLNIETRFQYERGYSKQEEMRSVSHYDMRRIINTYTLVNPDGTLNYQFPMGAGYFFSKSDFEAWTWRNQFNYSGAWHEDTHQLTMVLGQEMRMYRNYSNSHRQYGLDPVSLSYIPVNEAELVNMELQGWGAFPAIFSKFAGYSEQDNRDVSFYMNGAYTFRNKYTLTASGRMDQSNIFGNDSKYKYNIIWSSGLSWRINKEDFIKADWIDNLVIRLTYGIGGNVNKNFYPVLMGERSTQNITGLPYIHLTNPANKDLKWETSTTLNLGIDFAFCGNRLSGSADIYDKASKDLIGRLALDPTNGFNAAQFNFASVNNRGVELTLNATALKTKDFTWNLDLNFTYNRNKVTKVDAQGASINAYLSPTPPGNGVAIKGKPLGRLYAYRNAGVDQEGSPLLWQNGEKKLYSQFSGKPEDLKYIGTLEAPYFGGFGTRLSYKGLHLSANFIYKAGHYFKLPATSLYYGVGNYQDVAERWQKPGDEDITNVPALKDYQNIWDQITADDYYTQSDLHFHRAGYVRFKDLSLDYDLPALWIEKMGLQSLNVRCQIRNIACWNTNKLNIDPETVSMAVNGSASITFSEPRTFILGLRVTF